MILNNYWEWQRQKEIGGTVNSGVYADALRQTYIKDYQGDFLSLSFIWLAPGTTIAWWGTNSYIYQNYMISSNCGFTISSSSEEISVDDYALPNEISHTNNSISVSVQNVDSALKQIVTCSGTNGTGDDVIIRKVGIWKRFFGVGSNNVSELKNKCYLAIVDLEEPIEVPAGKGFTITVDLTEQ